MLGDLVGVVAGIGGVVVGVGGMVYKVRGCVKEWQEVVDVGRKIIAKYSDVDDDAKRFGRELEQAVAATKGLLKLK